MVQSLNALQVANKLWDVTGLQVLLQALPQTHPHTHNASNSFTHPVVAEQLLRHYPAVAEQLIRQLGATHRAKMAVVAAPQWAHFPAQEETSEGSSICKKSDMGLMCKKSHMGLI
jgi:hypothetical protein